MLAFGLVVLGLLFEQLATLLVAILITVLIAIPTLILAATVEVYIWPHILEALSPVA